MGRKRPDAGDLLAIHLRELSRDFRREWAFFPGRKWRFDFALGSFINGQTWEPNKTAIEIEGAVWTQGRHTRGAGYMKDLEKYRTAAAIGWRVYRFSTQEVLDGTARQFLAKWA